MIGKDEINIAAAGVGTPINETPCLVSVLYFASLMAEKIGIRNANKEIKNSLFIIDSL